MSIRLNSGCKTKRLFLCHSSNIANYEKTNGVIYSFSFQSHVSNGLQIDVKKIFVCSPDVFSLSELFDAGSKLVEAVVNRSYIPAMRQKFSLIFSLTGVIMGSCRWLNYARKCLDYPSFSEIYQTMVNKSNY